MKKIMFNDKYGLTDAVLNGNKTMTRRIIPLTDADRDYLDNAFDWDLRESVIIDRYAKYKVGEIVAVAQSYCKLYAEMIEDWSKHNYHIPREDSADLMPHRIRITGIKVERLQEISREDCLLEGIYHDVADGFGLWWWDMEDKKLQNELLRHEWNGKEGLWFWDTPQGAFASLIDNVGGKGTWDRNPWVFAYSFELTD